MRTALQLRGRVVTSPTKCCFRLRRVARHACAGRQEALWRGGVDKRHQLPRLHRYALQVFGSVFQVDEVDGVLGVTPNRPVFRVNRFTASART
jgi:hypothetical protein